MKSDTTALMIRPKDEIVVYKPDATTRIDVRMEGRMAWLNRQQMATLFGRDVKTIGKHITNALKEELNPAVAKFATVQPGSLIANNATTENQPCPTVAKFATVQIEGGREVVRQVEYYNLEMVVSVGFHVKSPQGVLFRRWANWVIERQIAGISAYEPRMTKLENRMDALELELKRAEPLPEQLFCEGQFFDAYNFFCDLIRKAKRRVYLIDNYVNDSVLTMFDKRGKNVVARIYTGKFPKQLQLDLARHNAQYAPIEIVNYPSVHDRFLIIDDAVWLVGASMKDAGKKKFAVIKTQLTPEAVLPLTKH